MSPSAQPNAASDVPATQAALARNLMVDGQLRPSRVTDRRILDAMRAIPREAFLPPDLAGLAYIDDHVPLGGGRALLKPLSLARLLQLARPTAGETALIVGSATGYGAAILAACGVHVTALEEDTALLTLARAAPVDPESAGTIAFVQGPLADGHPAGAPYDLVVIEGAVREIPTAIGAQVGAHGRLVAIVCPPGGTGTAVLAEPSVGGLRAQAAFDASAPLLSSLVAAPAFTF